MRRWSAWPTACCAGSTAALAAFVHGLDAQAEPTLLVATAVLAQMEGRGHSCLPLAGLHDEPNAVLAWPREAQPLLRAL